MRLNNLGQNGIGFGMGSGGLNTRDALHIAFSGLGRTTLYANHNQPRADTSLPLAIKSYIMMSSDCLSIKLYLLSNRAVFGKPVQLQSVY